jgi:alkaline phosphatase D
VQAQSQPSTPAAGSAPPAPKKEEHGQVLAAQFVPGLSFLHAGPLVGHVTSSSASLWAKGSNSGRLDFKVGREADLSDGQTISGGDLVEESSFTGQVVIDGLEAATRYYYTPLLDGEAAISRPYPSFSTAPVVPGKLRVAFGSCVGQRGYLAAAAFGEMAARRNFDVLLMIGDNHYGDTTDPALLRDHYHMHRTVGGFSSLIREIPTYAIWDDHDFGPNNSDGATLGKEDSLRVFREWWANPAYGEPENPGCYFQFSRPRSGLLYARRALSPHT